ncbi:MAG: hypothetical protein ACTSUD_14220 [Alphaproteobacteria bacterium]
MSAKRTLSILAGVLMAAMLAGCSGADDVVFKALAGEKPGEKGSIPDAIATGALASAPPGLGRTRFRKPATTKKPAAAKGAAEARLRAGFLSLEARIFRHDDELERLRRSLALHYAAYRKAVAGFGLRKKRVLPANDEQYRANMAEARRRLARVNGDLLKLNTIAAKVNTDVAQASQLLAEVRAGRAAARGPAFGGLSALESDVAGMVGTTHRMLAEIHLDISSQATYANAQSRGLDQLAAVVAGGAPTAAAAPNKTSGGSAAAPPSQIGARSARPLVRIRFAAAKVAYEAPLYEALKAALAKRPGLEFEVVGVARTAGGRAGALSHAQQVMFSMAEMGVPPSRVSVSSAVSTKITADEVHLYVR